MIRVLVYAFIFYIIYQVIKIYYRIKKSVSADRKKPESKYRNVEEADYKEISNEPKKPGQE